MTCKAVGDPWHGMWQHFQPTSAAQRRIVVADLISPHDSSWNIPLLIELFGFHGALFLAVTYPNGLNLNAHPDRPIFTVAKNGIFSLKKAYALIHASRPLQTPISLQMQKLLKVIWGCLGILPRVKIFLWKLVHSALPVDHLFVTRLRKPPQGCPICGSATEDVVHTLFKCPEARRIWLSSNLGIRTEALPDDIVHLLSAISMAGDNAWFGQIASFLWSFWKARCKQVFEGIGIRRDRVIAQAASMVKLTTLAHVVHCTRQQVALAQTQQGTAYYCYVDGSWLHAGDAGAGWSYVLVNENNELVQYQMSVSQAVSPFHAEMQALRGAVDAVRQGGFLTCSFFTDCANLHKIVTGVDNVQSADWPVYSELLDLVFIITSGQDLCCNLIGREGNQLADSLARHARDKEIAVLGYRFPIM